MKTTENKTIIGLVERLAGIIEMRRTLEADEKEVKSAIKDILAGFEVNVLGAGDFVVILSDRTRTDVDKKKLKVELGERYAEFETKTDYQILEVKKA